MQPWTNWEMSKEKWTVMNNEKSRNIKRKKQKKWELATMKEHGKKNKKGIEEMKRMKKHEET